MNGDHPACPVPHSPQCFPGMTMRDELAKAALAVAMKHTLLQSESYDWQHLCRGAARRAYQMADAMIEASNEQ